MKNGIKKHSDKLLILICIIASVGAFVIGRQIGGDKSSKDKVVTVKKEKANNQATADKEAAKKKAEADKKAAKAKEEADKKEADKKEAADKKAAADKKKKAEEKAKSEKEAEEEKKAAEKNIAEKEAARKAAEKKLAEAEELKNKAKAEAEKRKVEVEKAKKEAKELLEKRAKEAEKAKEKAKEEADKKAKASKSTTALPKSSVDDWQLLLVNGKNPLKNEKVDLEMLSNGYQVDKRIASDFEDFEKEALKNGVTFVIVSSYRSVSDQQTVFDNSVKEHLNNGSSQKEAEKLTREYITVPGTSEHHTGLAIDVIDENWSKEGKGLEDSFYDTKAGKWIDQHAADYGFVIRYPADKVKITSINYEPWHLRYVGKENAHYMKDHNLVLEEYLELLKNK